MKNTVFISLLIISSTTLATAPWLENLNHPNKQQQIDLRWHADGGEFLIDFDESLLNEINIHIEGLPTQSKIIDNSQYATFKIRNTSSLALQAPFGILQGIPEGRLQLVESFKWTNKRLTFEFENLMVQSSPKSLKAGEIASMDITNASGEVLFNLSNIHTQLDIKKNQLKMMRMDVRISPWLAQKLNMPFISNWVVGQAEMYNHFSVPVEYLTVKGDPTCPADRPLWPTANVKTDVSLINMDWSYRRRIDDDHVVFTPDATLKNTGEADVAWYGKFTGDYDPYNNAQHPYLNWSMYREIDNRFEQLGLSGIKHAFYTVNTNCDINCGNHHILYKGCEDIYTVLNNDGGTYLGPREELSAFTGVWEQQCSFFDPGCTNSQTHSSNSTDENRLVVAEADFSDPNLDYYFSSWYVIRDDDNIFNSMGHRSYDLVNNQPSDTWSLSNGSAFNNGPASDAYLPPNTTAKDLMSASHRTLQAGEGHLTVAVKVVDLGAGLYRYNYMVENHDYDPQVEKIEVPLMMDASFSNFIWSDSDLDSNNDWQTARMDDVLVLTPQNNNHMDWGMLFSFSFTTDRPPESGAVKLTGHENSQNTFSILSLRPQLDDLIFEDGFELPMP